MIDDEESDILKSGLKERRRNITSILYQVDVDEITDFPKEEKDRKIYNQFNNLINNSNQEIYKTSQSPELNKIRVFTFLNIVKFC